MEYLVHDDQSLIILLGIMAFGSARLVGPTTLFRIYSHGRTQTFFHGRLKVSFMQVNELLWTPMYVILLDFTSMGVEIFP